MNILYICDEFPPGKTGGIGIATELLAKGMVARGHQVCVAGICMHGYGAEDFEKRSDGIEVWRLRYFTDKGIIKNKDRISDKILTHGLRWSGLLAIDARKRFQQLMQLVEEIIKSRSIDVIEMPDWNNFFFNLSPEDFSIPAFNKPLVVKMHGSHSYLRSLAGLPLKKKVRDLEDKLYARADYLVAVSAFTANEGRRIFNLERPITILYNGIKVGNYHGQEQRSNKNSVLFSGSLLPNKGIYQLVSAWSSVLKKHPDAILHIYGKGNQLKIRQLLSGTIANSVQLHGHIPREVLLQKLEEADLAVFPSFSETFGMAPAEAMAVGCPVVFTKRSSGPEVITNLQEGWLVDPANVEEIADVICNALGAPAVREKYAKAAYQKVKERFSLESVALQHEDFYTRIASEFNSR